MANEEPIDSGVPHPQRRADDVPTSHFEWITLVVALLTFGATYLNDLAQYKTWIELVQPSVFLTKLGQLCGVILAVTTAKRMK